LQVYEGSEGNGLCSRSNTHILKIGAVMVALLQAITTTAPAAAPLSQHSYPLPAFAGGPFGLRNNAAYRSPNTHIPYQLLQVGGSEVSVPTLTSSISFCRQLPTTRCPGDWRFQTLTSSISFCRAPLLLSQKGRIVFAVSVPRPQSWDVKVLPGLHQRCGLMRGTSLD